MSEQYKGYARGHFSSQLQFVGHYGKPNIEYVSEKIVKISASTWNPAHFVIGGMVKSVQSDLVCNLNISGPGGLSSEASLTNSTIYYVYVVPKSATLALVADSREPGVGPRGYPTWSYVGSFLLNKDSEVEPFAQVHGDTLFVKEVAIAPNMVNTSYSSKTLPIPKTSKTMTLSVSFSIFLALDRQVTLSLDGTTDARVIWSGNVVQGTTLGSNQLSMPTLGKQTIYYKIDSSDNEAAQVSLNLLGYQENFIQYP